MILKHNVNCKVSANCRCHYLINSSIVVAWRSTIVNFSISCIILKTERMFVTHYSVNPYFNETLLSNPIHTDTI